MFRLECNGSVVGGMVPYLLCKLIDMWCDSSGRGGCSVWNVTVPLRMGWFRTGCGATVSFLECAGWVARTKMFPFG